MWFSLDKADEFKGVLSACNFEDEEGGMINVPIFVGNLISVVGLLLIIFLVHVLVVSGVEAYWLSKVRQSIEHSTLPFSASLSFAVKLVMCCMSIAYPERGDGQVAVRWCE